MGRIGIAAALALVGFAGNSLLCRLALRGGEIDAASFTGVRLATGALALVLLAGRSAFRRGSWLSALALFVYAAPFSFAYLRIDAAVGALVLFGVVQLTMIGYALARGERPGPLAWTGIVLAGFGLGLLTVPSVSRPDPFGLVLMAIAGLAWAAYSIAGKSLSDPLASNARSFILSSPIAIALVLASRCVSSAPVFASGRGIALAVTSGAITSGLGYACWYRVLPRLSVTQAAVSQLTVPIIAALAAVGLLNESLSGRLVLSGAAVLSGVGLVLFTRSRKSPPSRA